MRPIRALNRNSSFLPEHPQEILAFATRHDYPKLVEEVVPALVYLPVVDVLPLLPMRYVEPWVRDWLSICCKFNKSQRRSDISMPGIPFLRRLLKISKPRCPSDRFQLVSMSFGNP